MYLLKKLQNCWRGEDILHRAAIAGNYKTAEKLSHDINLLNSLDSSGYTPLRYCLNGVGEVQDRITILFLERGANPNLCKAKKVPLIQFYLFLGDYSRIRLLAIYGAEISSVQIQEISQESLQFYRHSHAIYLKKLSLEQQANNSSLSWQLQKIAYLELATLWGEVANEEDNITFKAHYFHIARINKEKADNLASAFTNHLFIGNTCTHFHPSFSSRQFPQRFYGEPRLNF